MAKPNFQNPVKNSVTFVISPENSNEFSFANWSDDKF